MLHTCVLERMAGPLHEANLAAWCAPCNLTWGRRDAADRRLVPREWQLSALDGVVDAIMKTGAATVSAAPGAGKTVFAGLIFEALREIGVVDRMLAFVPRRGLVSQWVDSLRPTATWNSNRTLPSNGRGRLARS